MFYEKKLASLPALFRELQIMDLDSGIRIHARHNGKRAFIFVTKTIDEYSLAIYDLKREGKVDFPGRQIEIKEMEFEELRRLLAKAATKPLLAFAY